MKINLLFLVLILSSIGLCTSESECPEQVYYLDDDGDGFGDLNHPLNLCEDKAGYVLNSTDCDDSNASIHPEAQEIYGNEIDENCNPSDDKCAELGVYDGYLQLSSQQEVIDFASLCIEEIIGGGLEIGGSEINLEDPITDISYLQSLKRISDELVIRNNYKLQTLKGLENLVELGKILVIRNNDKLVNLQGLDNLEGFNYAMEVDDNESLVDFSGLEKIRSFTATVSILNNPKLQSFNGLNNVTHFQNLLLVKNESLVDLKMLKAVQGVQNLILKDNTNLKAFFDESFTPGGMLVFMLTNSPNIKNLKGLMDKSSFIGGSVVIQNNLNLESLEGLNPAPFMGFDVQITDCPKLINLHRLSNIETVQRDLRIVNNSSIVSLQGLENVRSVGLKIPMGYPDGATPNHRLEIGNNSKLVDLCSIGDLINKGYTQEVSIHGNMYNPTIHDFGENKCKL
ncbi:putative metal-binding motif-containing protein [Algoriphagus sp. A40]|uniref:putative metal-binding motif-containing protein n=1 Tax=Algoriphagus sp. A40 TaxID=1945863 RepID=UPI00098493FC|nr:putative metal-binding motif-containing protein [Algoriphagus sp. A40]OOG69933.1 hypothetical protein B0E43_19680 [Algoriphagus sp. A40]